MLVVLATLAGVATAWARHAGAHRLDAATARAAAGAAVTERTLPADGGYASMAVIAGRLVVWGGDGVEQVPAAAGRAARCTSAQVDPVTLALSDRRQGDCLDPALFHERVMPSLDEVRGGPSGDIVDVRISRALRGAASGRFHLGPVLLREEQCSSCALSLIYGAGALWIYAPNPVAAAPTRGQLLRISDRSGAVTGRWTLPSLERALLAVDADGLWIAPSLFSGEPEHVPVAQQREYHSLYRVAVGGRSVRRSAEIAVDGARWMVASAHSVILESGSPQAPQVTRFDGSRTRVAYRVRADVPPECLASGEGPSGIAGTVADGIFCLGSGTDPASTQVFRFDASSGHGQVLTRIGALGQDAFGQPAAIVGHAGYFLRAPQFIEGARGQLIPRGSSALYRIEATPTESGRRG